MSNVKTSDVQCNLPDLILSSLLDVMLHIISHLVNIVNDYPALTPISPASACHTEIIPVHDISNFNYYYYSYMDCGKTATYSYTVPPIWHNFCICHNTYYIKCICNMYMYIDANWK